MPLNFDALHPLTHNLPPIVMLSSSDLPGAGGATLKLHTGLIAAGADVTTLVMSKTSNRGGVLEIAQGPKLEKVSSIMALIPLAKHLNRPPYFEMFSIAKSPVNLAHIDSLRETKLVHLHWVAGMVGFPQAGKALSGKNIVWTLHDMNPLAGGCHCTAGCGKYANGGCETCPQLGVPTDNSDIAAQNFSAKRTGYANMDMTVVAPGKWLTDCARESKLLGKFPQSKISHSVDPYVFTPLPRTWARAAFALPPERKVIAFGAAGIERWNKGLQILKLALEVLRPQWRGALPLLLVFGGDAGETLPQGYDCLALGKLSPSELAKVYSAADIFVSASLQEAFGLVTAEAQACGTPGIGFYGTGAEDIIQDGVTGYLAAHPGFPLTTDGHLKSLDEFLTLESVGDLAAKIKMLLELPDEQMAVMRECCREHALREFSPVLQTGRYLRLYRRILGLPEVTVEGLPK